MWAIDNAMIQRCRIKLTFTVSKTRTISSRSLLNIIHSMKINFLIKTNYLGFILDKFIAVVKKETLKRDKNHLKVIHSFFCVFLRMFFFRPRKNILIFLPMLD